jgi:hypothetical protein
LSSLKKQTRKKKFAKGFPYGSRAIITPERHIQPSARRRASIRNYTPEIVGSITLQYQTALVEEEHGTNGGANQGHRAAKGSSATIRDGGALSLLSAGGGRGLFYRREAKVSTCATRSINIVLTYPPQ